MQLEFNSLDLGDLKTKLCLVMPRFRTAMEQNNTREFYETLGRLSLNGLATFGVLSLIGVIAILLGLVTQRYR
jgi:hypothetical protein